MAKTKIHELEYIEQGFLEPKHRVKCACGIEQEVDSVADGLAWHAEHREAERLKAEEKARRAQTA